MLVTGAVLVAAIFVDRGLAAPPSDAVPPTARQILIDAFAKRYDVDYITKIELVMRNRSGQERRRRFHAVSKVVDGMVHSIGRLVWPEHLRGMTILTIENENRSHDAFVYLPSLEKTRRITTANRGDAFLGSDVTYEDLERRRVDEYDLGGLRAGETQGEPVYVIRAESRETTTYSAVEFAIAQRDNAILEARYFKRSLEEPFRVLTAPRASIVEEGGHLFPTVLVVRNDRRGTSTEVLMSDLVVNPEIDSRVFSVTTLDQQRDLPRPE